MTCKDIADFLADYQDRTLPVRQRWMFQLHLCFCRDCRRYVNSYQRTIALAHSLKDEREAVDSSPVPEDLVRAILATRGVKPQRHDETP